MPGADALLDSNILVYALSDDPSERPKHIRAAELLAAADFGTSYQILMETWVVATRKMQTPVALQKVAAFLDRILEFPCVQGDPDLYRHAFQLSHRFGVHPYDAALLAAAHELGADCVWSEDLSHGQDYDGVRVLNPFV